MVLDRWRIVARAPGYRHLIQRDITASSPDEAEERFKARYPGLIVKRIICLSR